MKKWKLWMKILFLEGLCLLSLGFGWALGTRAGPSLKGPLFLIGLGFLGILGALALWSGLIRRQGPRALRAWAPIDLQENERALKAYGEQAPLIDDEDLIKTEHRVLEHGQRWSNLPLPLVIEHWGGRGTLKIVGAQNTAELTEKHLLRIPANGPAQGSVDLYNEDGSSSVLVHFLSAEETVE